MFAEVFVDYLIQVERKPTHVVIRMNRPEKKNAMNRAARRGLLEAFELARETTKVVVLTGCAGSFCSGVDLKEYRDEVEGRLAPEPETDWINVNLAIRRHPAVFIAAVNGIALGGGATLIGVCDLAIAADDAEIGLRRSALARIPNFQGRRYKNAFRQSAPPGWSSPGDGFLPPLRNLGV
jgi:enoyl-CoA hydratase/carnithine racemase